MNKTDPLASLILNHLCLDSREVKPGSLFLALPGTKQDGRHYIQAAIQQGASAVLMECDSTNALNSIATHFDLTSNSDCPIIPFQHLNAAVGPIAARFYDHPSQKMPIIGVTGTNGKTSVTHYIAEILGKGSCGVIGTLGNGFIGQFSETNLTTPSAIQIQQLLHEFLNKGAKTTAMEVTSHALDQFRVSGVVFNTAIFTNLSRDHLDYHRDMAAYGETKKKLFMEYQPSYSVINIDDAFGLNLTSEVLKTKRTVWAYTTYPELPDSLPSTLANITTHHLKFTSGGFEAEFHTPQGKIQVECPLLGLFNVSNVLGALAAVLIQGFPLEQAKLAIQNLTTVKGRMEKIEVTDNGNDNGAPTVILDYAHTPDALMQALKALRKHCKGKLWTVFGCGGDRDRGKRKTMAITAETLSDYVVITQDNPRTESPRQIIEDILTGIKTPQLVYLQEDRDQAILHAITKAAREDWILIAGKGHEPYQIIGTEKRPFSDRQSSLKALEIRKHQHA